MKLTCKQQDLARGLSTVSHAVSTRSTLPILSNILLSAENGRLRLSATNLEIGITCWVPANIQEEGTTTSPSRLLTDFVNTLPPADVSLALQPSGQSLKVSDQRSQATIRGMEPGEFPTIPTADGGEPPLTVSVSDLRTMIGEVAFAAATDDARPVFTGVLARARDGRLTFAAADSFRLAVRSVALTENGAASATTLSDMLIPARTLSELAKVLPDDGTVYIVVTPNRNQVLFRIGDDLELVSTLISGQFPNYEVILPKSRTTRVTLPTDELRQAAKQASIFARDSANIVRLKVAEGQGDGLTPGAVILSATAEENGDTTSTRDGTVDGPGMEIIFNVKYLTDVLGVLSTSSVALELNSPQQPGVIKPVGDEGSDYQYVIMPMHSTR
ncbi:MAG TPA: DNA polymerase III subunit beta [Ktedonobacterales bacterium]|nr:DNA polymerase III subunit beta [Ktedonobacterales bacterium]